MSDNFNPYAEWLGLAANLTSPNFYQLLGIDQSVTDPAAITSAADRTMTRVRAHKPGQHAAAWAQLLDQISVAKSTLANPTQRESYNQQLAHQPPGGPDLLSPTQGGAQPTVAPQARDQAIDPMAPVSLAPQPVAIQSPQPASATSIPQAIPYIQPATPPAAASNPMAPVGNAVPVAPLVPTIPQAVPNPMAPVAQGSSAPLANPTPISPMAPIHPAALPSAVPTQPAPHAPQTMASVAGPMLATQPVNGAQSAKLGGTPKLKRKRTATARARSKSGGLLGPILLGGSVGGLVLVVVGIAFYLAGSSSKSSTRPVADGTPAPVSAGGDESTSTIPRRLDEIPDAERPQPEIFTPPTPSEDVSPESMTTPTQPMTEPAPTTATTPMTPAPESPAPEPPSEPEPSRAELRELAQALTTARAAIGELNFPVVARELAKALPLAKLDEHQEKVRRLKLLSEYVGRYRGAITETLSRMNAGDQIDLGDNRSFGIVELTPDLLVIRISGRNLRYPMDELPAGLATRLAEMSLDKTSPETTALKAAYVSVNPKIGDDDLEKVKSWWQEAASVRDVPDLVTAINDDYSLKQDMMAVPLAPNAMAELTARADRLKDARKLADFAQEYQAAIDESLKTLEPETELAVGGSTTVTIQEVKPDRVMLTVAGETRGFQISKLPLGLAASIAERNLPRDTPLTMVMKGAYFAAREKDQSNKQFRPMVLAWWKQAGEMDPTLQAVIQELVKQYPE